MRFSFVLSLVLASGSVFAQSALKGAKADISVGNPTAAGGPGPWALLQLLLALGIVAALLKFVLPRFAPTLKNRAVKSLGATLTVQETTTFPGGSLMVVKVRGKELLIGATAQSITFLSEIHEEQGAPAFFDLVDAAPGKEMPIYAVIPEEAQMPISAEQREIEQPAKDEVMRRLARLQKLAG